MDGSTLSFGDLQNEERFRKLKRKLKKSMFLCNKSTENSNSSPSFSTLSTIHTDELDSLGQSVQDSRAESNIISSSKNLQHLRSINCPKPITTSSVKNYFAMDIDKDRAMMPPPSNFLHSKKLTQNEEKITSPNVIQGFNSVSPVSSIVLDRDNANSKKHSENSHGYTIIYKWRLLLNNDSQLIIKGTLEGGRIVRSKPIIKRFSYSKVQSIHNYVYKLDGKLVDERREMPEYVREKFINGFPDDWENVYQLWKNFVSTGCQVTFRWPTRITDSDDDIISEVTYEHNSYPKNKINRESLSIGYHSKTSFESNQNSDKSKNEKSTEFQILSENKNINSNNTSIIKNISCKCSSEHDSSSYSLNGMTNYCDIIKEDKLRIILSNLSDKKCPKQYLYKFFESIECLKTILFLTTHNSDSENQKQNISINEVCSSSEVCKKCNSISSFKEPQDTTSNKEVNNTVQSIKDSKESRTNISSNSNLEKNKSSHEQQSSNFLLKPLGSNIGEYLSDNDNYMGLPNVSLNHLLKSNLQKPRFRGRRNHKEKISTLKNNYTNHHLRSNSHKSQFPIDSSVSFTEDEHLDEAKANKESYKSFHRNEKSSNYKQNSNYLIKSTDKQCDPTPAMDCSVEKNDLKSHSTKNYLEKRKDSQNISENLDKQKPFVKRIETVQYKINPKCYSKLKNSSGINLNDLECWINKQSQFNENYDAHKSSPTDVKEDFLGHPFLNYSDFVDSETDDSLIENSTRITNRSFHSKTGRDNGRDKETKLKPFGSEENPKILTAWIPYVVKKPDSEHQSELVFKGTLLNEAGHILDRKFMTNGVIKNHTFKLIETIDGEFFFLDGDLYDKKHVIPKELLKLCRNGCPPKIDEFCEEWIKNTLCNSTNPSIHGKKTIKKDASKIKCSISPIANTENSKKNLNKAENLQNINSETNTMNEEFKRPGLISNAENASESNPILTRKRIARQLVNSSSDSDEDEHAKKFKNRELPKRSALTESAYNSRLRKKQRCNVKKSPNESSLLTSARRVPENSSVMWTLTKEKNNFQDILSEDQASIKK